MKKQIYLLLTLFLIINSIACKNDKALVEPPANLLDQSKFETMLKEVHLAEALARDITLRKDSTTYLFSIQEYYQNILASHQVEEQVFEESFNYYSSNHVLLDSIYAHLIKELKEEKNQMEAREKSLKEAETQGEVDEKVESAPIKKPIEKPFAKKPKKKKPKTARKPSMRKKPSMPSSGDAKAKVQEPAIKKLKDKTLKDDKAKVPTPLIKKLEEEKSKEEKSKIPMPLIKKLEEKKPTEEKPKEEKPKNN